MTKLVFTSSDKALQHLADLTGKQVRVLTAGFKEQEPYLKKKIQEAIPYVTNESMNTLLKLVYETDPIAVKTNGSKSPLTKDILRLMLIHPDVLMSIANGRDVPRGVSQFFENEIKEFVKYRDNEKLSRFNDINELYQFNLSKRHEEKAEMPTPIAKYGGFFLYKITDWDKEGKVCFKDSGWCVKNSGFYDDYELPLYMITRGKSRFMLIHPQTSEVKNAQNKIPSTKEVEQIAPLFRAVFDNLIELFTSTQSNIHFYPALRKIMTQEEKEAVLDHNPELLCDYYKTVDFSEDELSAIFNAPDGLSVYTYLEENVSPKIQMLFYQTAMKHSPWKSELSYDDNNGQVDVYLKNMLFQPNSKLHEPVKDWIKKNLPKKNKT